MVAVSVYAARYSYTQHYSNIWQLNAIKKSPLATSFKVYSDAHTGRKCTPCKRGESASTPLHGKIGGFTLSERGRTMLKR